MRARNDPKQARITSSAIFGVVHDQFHLAADALESRFDFKFQNVAGALCVPKTSSTFDRLKESPSVSA